MYGTRHLRRLAGTLILATTPCSPGAENPPSPPNVVLIIVDDLNDWVGYLGGHPQTQTPHIDKLATRSVRFTNAHASAPLCGPSRTSMFSGLYPHRTGVYGHIHDADLKKVETLRNHLLLPTLFKKHRYKTMGVGKIFHITDGAQPFDEYGGVFERMGPKPAQRMSYDPSLFGTGKTQTDWGAFPQKDEDMPDHKTANWAVRKLQEQHHTPFFMVVGFLRPHVPWHVPSRWFKNFPVKTTQKPPIKEGDLDDISGFGKKLHAVPGMPPWQWMKQENRITEAAAAYLACVNFADAQVGKVIHALQKSPHANNTIIILTSDHGYHLGEKQRWAKHSLWERSSRVPLLIHIPNKHKVANGRKVHHTISNPVGLIDLYPTLADLCGLKQPAQLDGISLTPLISHHSPTTKQKEPAWRHSVMTVYGRGNISLRSKQYRYIRYADGSEELYDMLQDPNEWKNLCHGKPPQEINPVIQRFRQHIPKSFQHWSPYSYANINTWFNRDIEKSRQVTGRKQRTKYRPQKISPKKPAEIK